MADMDTIYRWFLARVTELGNRPAILSPGRPDASFADLGECVEAAKRSLLTHGIGRNSRIGYLVPDRPMAGVSHLLACCTGTSVPLNAAMAPAELLEAARDMRIDGILIGEGLTDALLQAAQQSGATLIPISPSGKTGLFEVPEGNAPTPGDPSPPQADDVAVVLQTSGTTSRPKIVPQLNSNRVATYNRSRGDMGIGPEDRCLNLMPLHHTQGVNAEFLTPLANGASVAMETFNPAELVRQVEKYRPTWFNLVPSMHQSVLDVLGDAEGVFTGSSLRYARVSSAKLTPAMREKLERAYGVPVAESYGSSETSNMASSGLDKSLMRDGSVGRTLHDGVIVADLDGDRLPSGERGEICVSGPTVIKGYENNPEANAEKFRDGWYRTGDEGYFDEDRYLYVTGRLQEVVNRGGEKFALSEIDDVLYRVNGVASGSAFTVPDERLGHEIYAAIVPAKGSTVTPASIRAELAGHLSWARVPKRVFIVDELPVNGTGKVMRDRLAENLLPDGR